LAQGFIYDLTVVRLFKCVFNLGPRAFDMLQAPRHLNSALSWSSFHRSKFFFHW